MTTNLNRQLENLNLGRCNFPSLDEARSLWAGARVAYGFVPNGGATTLLSPPDANTKIGKNEVPTWGLSLTPANHSGDWSVCSWSTPQCRKACVLWTGGRSVTQTVRQAHLVRTAFLAVHPGAFLALLTDEVQKMESRGVPFGLRLNVASDLRYENFAPWLFEGTNVRAYDYSKSPRRITTDKYRITYSHSERWTDQDIHDRISNGENVAVVFAVAKHNLPATHLGIPVIDGDLSDFRWNDPRGVIVGLAAKGAAKTMPSGAGQFVSIGRRAA